MNTDRLNGCYTASQFATVVKVLKEDARMLYEGEQTREYAAFLTLLEHDASKMVNAHIRNLNAEVIRLQRECAEWLALLPKG